MLPRWITHVRDSTDWPLQMHALGLDGHLAEAPGALSDMEVANWSVRSSMPAHRPPVGHQPASDLDVLPEHQCISVHHTTLECHHERPAG